MARCCVRWFEAGDAWFAFMVYPIVFCGYCSEPAVSPIPPGLKFCIVFERSSCYLLISSLSLFSSRLMSGCCVYCFSMSWRSAISSSLMSFMSGVYS